MLLVLLLFLKDSFSLATIVDFDVFLWVVILDAAGIVPVLCFCWVLLLLLFLPVLVALLGVAVQEHGDLLVALHFIALLL